jgi:hypothetical protein
MGQLEPIVLITDEEMTVSRYICMHCNKFDLNWVYFG